MVAGAKKLFLFHPIGNVPSSINVQSDQFIPPSSVSDCPSSHDPNIRLSRSEALQPLKPASPGFGNYFLGICQSLRPNRQPIDSFIVFRIQILGQLFLSFRVCSSAPSTSRVDAASPAEVSALGCTFRIWKLMECGYGIWAPS
jgi:hypothetical protein